MFVREVQDRLQLQIEFATAGLWVGFLSCVHWCNVFVVVVVVVLLLVLLLLMFLNCVIC